MNKVRITIEYNVHAGEYFLHANGEFVLRTKTAFMAKEHATLFGVICRIAGVECEISEVAR